MPYQRVGSNDQVETWNRLPLPDAAALSYGVAQVMHPTFLKLRSLCNMTRHRVKEGA